MPLVTVKARTEGNKSVMDLYTGNSLLYRYIKAYRHPVFLDRNMNYLFSHIQTDASDSGAQVVPRKRRRRKRRRMAIDEVCELIQTRETSVGNEQHSFLVPSTLKIETVALVKLARNLRSLGNTLVQSRSANCMCKIVLARIYGETRKPEVLYQSSGICTLRPTAETDSVIPLFMDEPFYINLSTLAETDSALKHPLSEYIYSVLITLRPTSSHSQQLWMSAFECTKERETSESPTPSPVRYSPRTWKPTAHAAERRHRNVAVSAVASLKRRLGIGLTDSMPSDGDADDEQNYHSDSYTGGMELQAEFRFSLQECPEPGYVVPLIAYKNHKRQELKAGAEVGLEINMGWSVVAPVVQPKVVTRETRSTTNIKETKEEVGLARSSTPMSDVNGPVEVRYKFAMNGKFKAFIMAGYTCAWCDTNYKSCERLHFHFLTCHDLFKFRVEQRQSRAVDIYISVAGEFAYERASQIVPDLRVTQWLSPRNKKFKLSSYLTGDFSWLQDGAVALPSQLPLVMPFPIVGRRNLKNATAVDELLVSMEAKWYDIETVPELPPKLKRQYMIPESEKGLYSTKSKRLLKTGELMSESEDEVDESWLMHLHEEILDDFEDVTPQEKILMKAWDRHLFAERPKSYKHVADTFVRFCRHNRRKFIEDEQQRLELWKLGLTLISRGMIEPGLFYACMKYLTAH